MTALPHAARYLGGSGDGTPSEVKSEYVARYAVGIKALDLGCGRGWYSVALANRGFSVTAVDRERRVDDPRVQFLAQDLRAPLPFADDEFSTTLMFDVLEHLDDEAGILGEVARVTQRRLILSVPHADDGFLPRYGLTYLHRVDRSHVREYTPGGLCATLESFGFRTLRVALEGRTHLPLAFAEFVRGPRWIKTLARYGLTVLIRLGLIYNPSIAGDIYWAGEKTGKSQILNPHLQSPISDLPLNEQASHGA